MEMVMKLRGARRKTTLILLLTFILIASRKFALCIRSCILIPRRLTWSNKQIPPWKWMHNTRSMQGRRPAWWWERQKTLASRARTRRRTPSALWVASARASATTAARTRASSAASALTWPATAATNRKRSSHSPDRWWSVSALLYITLPALLDQMLLIYS